MGRCAEQGHDLESDAALGPLPRELGRFCLDRYAPVRAYGASAAPIERACERVLGPGCRDEQERHGLERVVTARYVDADGEGTTLDLTLTRFEHIEGAYAHFTDQVIGDADPADLAAKPVEVPGVAVQGQGSVLGWQGRDVLWLHETNEEQPLEARFAVSERELPELLPKLLETLPARAELPAAVKRLPQAHRVPLGVRLMLGDALSVPGLGTSACGYYQNGDKRWRVLSIVRPDAESAKDVLGTLGRHPLARKIKGAPFDAIQFTERRLPSEPQVGWVVGRRGDVIYGIGDEATALPEFMPAEREARVKLSLHEKLLELTRI